MRDPTREGQGKLECHRRASRSCEHREQLVQAEQFQSQQEKERHHTFSNSFPSSMLISSIMRVVAAFQRTNASGKTLMTSFVRFVPRDREIRVTISAAESSASEIPNKIQ